MANDQEEEGNGQEAQVGAAEAFRHRGSTKQDSEWEAGLVGRRSRLPSRLSVIQRIGSKLHNSYKRQADSLLG